MWGNQGGYDQGYGGDQGGGYINSPGGSYGSPQQSQEKKMRQRAQNIIPCTVAQIQNANMEDDRFLVNGVELHQITMVGLVRTVKENPTRIDYEIDDMTGPNLEVKQFVDNDENVPDHERTVAHRENTYVRVMGHVRAFQGKRSCVAFRIIPLHDMNELTTHMLEVLKSHIFLSKKQNAQTDTGTTGFVPQPGGGQQSNIMQHDTGLNSIQQQVYDVIRKDSDEQGVSINTISENLRGMPQKAIRDAIEFLSGEGHIYSTIDDDHFKSTDS